MNIGSFFYPFFKNGKTKQQNGSMAPASESSVYDNHEHTEMTIEAKGDLACFPMTVYGYLDKETEPAWSPITGVNMNGFTLAKTIAAPGIYAYGVGGIQHVKVVMAAQGDATVSAKFGG